MKDTFTIFQTEIETSGVFRCCLSPHVGHDKGEFRIGDKSQCRYCNQMFTLCRDGSCRDGSDSAIWKPDWQIEMTQG